MKSVVLVKYGEIYLRGKNRVIFENRLLNTLRKNLEPFGNYKVLKEQGRFVIESSDDSADVHWTTIKHYVSTVLGIVGFCPCLKIENVDIENIKKTALYLVKEQYGNMVHSFKVETKRADKRYPLTSYEISSDVGAYVLSNNNGWKVDVKNPDITINIEIRNRVYVYSNVIEGFGGLPTGVSGSGVLLLSGGIDSAVAGFMMAKRGVSLEAIYFHSPPFTSDRAKDKAIILAKRLSCFTGGIKLHVINFTDIQTYLYENVPHEKLTIFIKRAMLKIAENLLEKIAGQCIITGDSVGQVASQTLKSIEAIDSSTDKVIIRPLAGMDKQEIINIAKKIDTYDISVRPYEDCCTIFVSKHPEIYPKRNIIEKIEKRLEALPVLLQAVFENEIIEKF